jgi:23S rRNA pseudouridine1911/1915/1917 synthase
MTNEGYEYEEIVGPDAHGRTALGYLAHRYTHSSRARWAGLGAGEVSLDGVPAAAGDLLRTGQRLAWRRPPWEEGAVPLAFALLHRDEHLLAVPSRAGCRRFPAAAS